MMDQESLHGLIKSKLADGSLAPHSIRRVWGGEGNGEVCDACDLVIEKAQFVLEGVSTDLTKGALQFHVQCFLRRAANRAGTLIYDEAWNPVGGTSREGALLWTIAVILLVLWALGMVSSYTAGGVVHLLLVIAIIVIVIQFIGGRRSI